MSDILILALWTTIAILVGSFIGFLVVRRVRSWYRADSDESSIPFTLQDLRGLKARGEITEVEYEAMRRAMIGRAAADPPRRAAEATKRRLPADDDGHIDGSM